MSYYDPQTKMIHFGKRPAEAKPIHCAFCGRTNAEVVGDCTQNPSYYFVICSCEASGPTDKDRNAAIDKWNIRYGEPRDPDRSYDGRPDYWCASSPERKPY